MISRLQRSLLILRCFPEEYTTKEVRYTNLRSIGCMDCQGQVNRVGHNPLDDSFERDEQPVYKLNSVIDWLDHRKHRIKE